MSSQGELEKCWHRELSTFAVVWIVGAFISPVLSGQVPKSRPLAEETEGIKGKLQKSWLWLMASARRYLIIPNIKRRGKSQVDFATGVLWVFSVLVIYC